MWDDNLTIKPWKNSRQNPKVSKTTLIEPELVEKDKESVWHCKLRLYWSMQMQYHYGRNITVLSNLLVSTVDSRTIPQFERRNQQVNNKLL